MASSVDTNMNGGSKGKSISMWTIFKHSDPADVFMMLLGTLGSIGEGTLIPIGNFVITSSLLNILGNDPHLQNPHSMAKINKILLKFLYLAVGVWFAAFLEAFCWTRVGERKACFLRREYLRSVLRQDVGFFHARGTHVAEVVNSVYNDTVVIQDTISEKVPNFVMNLAYFVACYTASFFLTWKLALVTLPLTTLVIVPGLLYGRTLMGLAKKIHAEYSTSSMIAEQAISAIRTIYSFVGEQKAADKFSAALDGTVKLGLRSGFAKGVAIGGNAAVCFAMWAFMSWYGSKLVIDHKASPGNVFSAGFCVIFGGLSLGSALPNLKYFSEAAVAASGIYEMIDRVPEIDSEDMNGKVLQTVSGEIQFRNVAFAYPSRPDSAIFQNFCLTIPARQTVALVGSSGSGKSTSISLIERFYDPLKGEILLDGENIKNLQLKWLRSQIGLVSQEPTLFATTIRENILFGRDDATMEEIISVARASNAHDFIRQLPNGYETQVGDRGLQMSGGQKQRIAIARAMLKNPSILLLDEATSALDAESEHIVQDALQQASIGRTTVIVAHRLSTIQGADKIAVVKNGEVIEFGGHHELFKKPDGAYVALWQTQEKAAPSNSLMQARTNSRNFSRNFSRNLSQSLSRMRSYASSRCDSIVSDGFMSDLQLDVHDAEKRYPASPAFKRLLVLSAPEWKRTVMGCLGALGYGVIQIVYSFTLAKMASTLFVTDINKLKSEVRIYCIAFLGLALVAFITNLMQHYNFAMTGEFLSRRIRQRMFLKILTFEVGWFDLDQNSSSAVCSTLAKEVNTVKSLVSDRFSLLVECVSGILVAFILGLALSWRLGIVLIGMQPLLVICFYTRKVLLQAISRKSAKAQVQGSQVASECFTHHSTIAAFCSQEKVIDLFDSTQASPHQEIKKQSWYAGIGLGTSQFITLCYVPFVYWYAGKLMKSGDLSFSVFLLSYFIFLRTGRMIADAGTMTSDLAKGSQAASSVFEILGRNSLIDPDNEGESCDEIRGAVEAKHVDFAYPSRPEAVILSDFCLKISARSHFALVGRSGCGKSTIIGLIERFYDPLNGKVLIDGRDIRSLNLRSLRKHIALVGQEPTLFAGSIRENIAYGKDNATETEIVEAAKAANAHEFISGLKDGYETDAGNRGTQLSGGQKQRIAIARAIIKNPRILLLDEATSALDSHSEKVVQQALDKVTVGRTSIVVAHRLSTIQNADCIAVFENGKVVEKGSHSELLRKGEGGAYFALVKLQQRQ